MSVRGFTARSYKKIKCSRYRYDYYAKYELRGKLAMAAIKHGTIFLYASFFH